MTTHAALVSRVSRLCRSTLVRTCTPLLNLKKKMMMPCKNWFDFNVFTYRTKQFRLQIPQFLMALDDKSAPFAYHSVIHMSTQTQTEGVSGTSQSYLSFRASQNSLLFKSKSISLIGKTVSQLDAPFWVARSTALKVFPKIELFTSSSFSFR